MFVFNNQKRPVTFTAPSGAITLIPGYNEIPDADAEALRPMAEAIGMFKSGQLRFGATKRVKSGNVEVSVGKTLKDLSVEEAEELIRETNSLDELEKLKKEDARDAVHLAIVNRIEEVKNYAPGEADKEGQTEA